MATNFEFYSEDIHDLIHGAMSGGKCLFGSIADKIGVKTRCPAGCNSCYVDLFKFLYAEHIEPPKLTKRERAFCEAVQTGWMARERNKAIYWYPDGYEITKGFDRWHCGVYSDMTDMKIGFEFIKWEDEKPWSIEDLLKLDVIEENPTSSNKDSNEVEE